MFYANDRRLVRWVHNSETVKPRAKGEGASLMVANLVSANYGWLMSPDGKECACMLFKVGKNRQGYFTNADVLVQAAKAMSILAIHFPNEDYVLVFDNAITHLKRADDALSATNMPKGTSKAGSNWGVTTTQMGDNGLPVYGTDSKVQKIKINMTGGKLHDGTAQSFYFAAGHPSAGLFKGMAILAECGLVKELKLSVWVSSARQVRPATAAITLFTIRLILSVLSHCWKQPAVHVDFRSCSCRNSIVN